MNDEVLSKKAIFQQLYMAWREQDRDKLWRWVKSVFKIKIPRKAQEPGNVAPFDYFADAFFGLENNILAIGNRTGGKTLMFAMLACMNTYLFKKCETTTAAAIENQAIRGYNYFQGFNENIDVFKDNILSSLRSETKAKNKSKVEIITGTMSGVNSPHPQKSYLDEVDLMQWLVLQEALSMAQSKHGIPAQTIVTSTRKFANGPMQRMVKESGRRGFKKYIWGIMEVLEPHDPKKCQETGFTAVCKNRCEELDGWYDFDDAVSKWLSLDPEIWEAQWMCTSPERKGLVYPQYIDDMFPRGNLYAHEFDPTLETYILEDFGSSEDHPNVNLFVQVDWTARPLPRIYVFDELYFHEPIIGRDVVGHVADKFEDDYEKFCDMQMTDGIPNYDFGFLDGWICDPAGITEIEERRRMGCPIMPKVKESELYKVANGVSLVRVLIKNRQYLMHPRCVKLREEVGSYSRKRLPDGTWSDQFQKKDDHGPDGMRYGAIRLMPMEAMQAIGMPVDEVTSETKTLTGGLLNRKL